MVPMDDAPDTSLGLTLGLDLDAELYSGAQSFDLLIGN